MSGTQIHFVLSLDKWRARSRVLRPVVGVLLQAREALGPGRVEGEQNAERTRELSLTHSFVGGRRKHFA